MIGVIATFECPSCGNLIKHEDVMQKKTGRFYFHEPRRCGCGRKQNFALVSFKSADIKVVDGEE